MSRVDRITSTINIPTYYSDFSTNLDRNQITGQLVSLTNEEAVKQSIINLCLTNLNERPYQPHAGSRIRDSLFENLDDPLTADGIRDSIIQCLQNNEPRATDVSVNMAVNSDSNGYDVQVQFRISNITALFMAQFTLSRIR